jgi:hypothetical protein
MEEERNQRPEIGNRRPEMAQNFNWFQSLFFPSEVEAIHIFNVDLDKNGLKKKL